MNCRRAQSEIALWAGDDLDETNHLGLQHHLESCPECRAYLAEMQDLLRLVDDCPLRDEADAASQQAVENSLWPSLSTRLAKLPAPQTDRFNGWVPALAVAAVCLVMVLVASPPQLLSPQDTHALAVSGEENWSGRQTIKEPVAPQTMHRLPIESMPVDVRGQRPVLLGNDVEILFPRDSPRWHYRNSPFPFFPQYNLPSQRDFSLE